MNAEKCRQMWAETRLLDVVPEAAKTEAALCLQGQYLTNSITNGRSDWFRMNIPLVVRVFAKCPYLLGSVKLLPENHVFETKFNLPVAESFHALNAEAEELARFSEEVAKEIKVLAETKIVTIHHFELKDDGTVRMNCKLEEKT